MRTYKLLFIALMAVLLLSGSCTKEADNNEDQAPNDGLAILTTTIASNITQTSATLGGTITETGGTDIIERGVCWNISPTPTITDNKTSDGTSIGSFVSNITGLIANTTYNVRAYATNSSGTAYGNVISLTTLAESTVGLPTIVTYPATDITQISATCGINLTSDEGTDLLAIGVCWSTNPVPTIADNKSLYGTGTITGLTVNTTYYARAYATNSNGTGYGNIVTFTTASIIATIFNPNLTYGSVTDIDGNVYKTITIGTQTWMAENLRTTKYRNGDLIGTTSADISTESTPKYQWPCGGDDSYLSVYGRLYTWHASTDSRNIAPTGWHVPSQSDLSVLIDYLGGSARAQSPRKLKEVGTNHWNTPNTSASNESGFTAVPGGWRDPYGNFNFIGLQGTIWSTNEYGTIGAGYLQIYCDDSNLGQGSNLKNMGFSIRCVKD